MKTEHRYVTFDPASPGGDYGAWVEYRIAPGGAVIIQRVLHTPPKHPATRRDVTLPLGPTN